MMQDNRVTECVLCLFISAPSQINMSPIKDACRVVLNYWFYDMQASARLIVEGETRHAYIDVSQWLAVVSIDMNSLLSKKEMIH